MENSENHHVLLEHKKALLFVQEGLEARDLFYGRRVSGVPGVPGF